MRLPEPIALVTSVFGESGASTRRTPPPAPTGNRRRHCLKRRAYSLGPLGSVSSPRPDSPSTTSVTCPNSRRWLDRRGVSRCSLARCRTDSHPVVRKGSCPERYSLYRSTAASGRAQRSAAETTYERHGIRSPLIGFETEDRAHELDLRHAQYHMIFAFPAHRSNFSTSPPDALRTHHHHVAF